MSFSMDTKNDLCALPVKKLCCKRAMLYAMLISGNLFSPERIRLITENERVSQTILRLLREVYGVRGNLYISEKKAGEGKKSSYKITVAARDDLRKIFIDCNLPPDAITGINMSLFVCEDCFRHFMRGCFLTAGMLTDPMTGYRMELIFENKALCGAIRELLSAYGFDAKYTTRKTSYVLYIKESEGIEDFLTFIGATGASLVIMNAKIYKDIRNTQNRLANCDTANINKMTGRAQQHIRAIKALSDAGRLDYLPSELKQTARLRLENPEASLEDLAKMHEPPLTKSGVNHRLTKLLETASKLPPKNTQQTT